MNINPQFDDEPEFINQIEIAVKGVLHRYAPPAVALIKIDNWFGSRWLGFSGKFLGAVGLTIKPSYFNYENLRIPPFVPERVVLQRRFAGPEFEEVNVGKPVHIHVTSKSALSRKAGIVEPGTMLAWYSGNSKANGRGALMAYVPAANSYWCWYVELERVDRWHVTEAREIKPDDFSRLMEEGSESLARSE